MRNSCTIRSLNCCRRQKLWHTIARSLFYPQLRVKILHSLAYSALPHTLRYTSQSYFPQELPFTPCARNAHRFIPVLRRLYLQLSSTPLPRCLPDRRTAASLATRISARRSKVDRKYSAVVLPFYTFYIYRSKRGWSPIADRVCVSL